MLFCCCYRSPTRTESSDTNNEKLNRLLKTIARKKYSHRCIVGDLNFRDINWSSWTTHHNKESTEANFLETVRDCYFFQHIAKATRRRGTDDPSLLDLPLMSKCKSQIYAITHHQGKVIIASLPLTSIATSTILNPKKHITTQKETSNL